MKTLEIKDVLKKDLLVVEMPEKYNLDYTYYREDDETEIAFYLGDDCVQLKLFKGDYTLLCKPDEIQEEDAIELVDKVMQSQHFQNYKARKEKDFVKMWCRTATESLQSAIESEIYWTNPFGNREPTHETHGLLDSFELTSVCESWQEAELHTFDRNRTLIFVKN